MKFRIIDRTCNGYHRLPDPDDQWDRGEEFTHHDIRGVVLVDEEDHRPWFDIETDIDVKVGDDVWFVYVLYSTGSTFGRADGRISYIDLFTDADEAFQLYRDLEADARADHEAWRDELYGRAKRGKKGKKQYEQRMKMDYSHNGNQKEVWIGTWKGYFERLQGIEVEKLTVYPSDYQVPSRW